MNTLYLTGGWESKVKEVNGEPVLSSTIQQPLPDGLFDLIICDHSLQCLEINEVLPKLKELYDHMAPRGELHLTFPSFEWLAGVAFHPTAAPIVQSILFGAKEYPHRTAHTIAWLRPILEQMGLVIREAKAINSRVKTVEGSIEEAIENYVIAKKYNEPDPIA